MSDWRDERAKRDAERLAASPALRALGKLKVTPYWTTPDAVAEVWRLCLIEGIADDDMLQVLTFGYDARELLGRLIDIREAWNAERTAAE